MIGNNFSQTLQEDSPKFNQKFRDFDFRKGKFCLFWNGWIPWVIFSSSEWLGASKVTVVSSLEWG